MSLCGSAVVGADLAIMMINVRLDQLLNVQYRYMPAIENAENTRMVKKCSGCMLPCRDFQGK